MAALVSANERAEWHAYERCSEFQAYQVARGLWEAAHSKYVNATGVGSEQARRELMKAHDEMTRLLEICRRTPEHLAATGWGGPPPIQQFNSLKEGDTFKAFPRAPLPHLAPNWVKLDDNRATLEKNFTGAFDLPAYQPGDIYVFDPSDDVLSSMPTALVQ